MLLTKSTSILRLPYLVPSSGGRSRVWRFLCTTSSQSISHSDSDLILMPFAWWILHVTDGGSAREALIMSPPGFQLKEIVRNSGNRVMSGFHSHEHEYIHIHLLS